MNPATTTTTTSNVRVARNVRTALADKGMTEEAFASQMGWSKTTTWRRLGGARWWLDEVEQAAQVLGVELDALNSEAVTA